MGIAFLLFVFGGLWAERAEARANLTAYTSVTPNGWEPLGYNVTGTAPYYVTHTLGWNDVKLMGNVGIGDGSVQSLDGMSNREIGYTDNYLMAGDVSAAPWDPGRLTSAPGLKSDDANKLSFDNNTSTGNSSENGTATTGPGQISAGNKLASMPLNDPYHSILLGRPVDDLAYEYPLAPTISSYFRLVGIPMPYGSGLASFSMRCLGYGY